VSEAKTQQGDALRLLKIMAQVLNINFIHAVLEAINYLVF